MVVLVDLNGAGVALLHLNIAQGTFRVAASIRRSFGSSLARTLRRQIV